jgi:myosin-1
MNMKTSAQGWTPQAYLEEQVAPAPKPAPPPPPPAPARAPATNGTSRIAAAKAKPTPPAPPMKRPIGGRKPMAAPDPRDSAVSMNSQDSSGGSGRATPNSIGNASLAGGLAEALRQRQSAMQGKKDDDDDW